MSTWTEIDRRMRKCSAIAIVVIATAYILTGLTWVVFNSNSASTQGLQPGEPFLSILETLILLLTPAIVLLFAAIHAYAPTDCKACSRAAFGFALLLAGIIARGTVHPAATAACSPFAGSESPVFALATAVRARLGLALTFALRAIFRAFLALASCWTTTAG